MNRAIYTHLQEDTFTYTHITGVLLGRRLQGGGTEDDMHYFCALDFMPAKCSIGANPPSSKDMTCTLSHLCVVCVFMCGVCVHVCMYLCMVLYAHYKNVSVAISCSALLVTSQIVYLPHAIRAPQFWRKFFQKLAKTDCF